MNKNKIFCIGFSKTGTTSMEKALEILGYNVCKGYWNTNHTFYLLALFVNKDYVELLRMTNYWDAFADAPWGGTDLYIKLLEYYKDAKFILTIRDSESWYTSFQNLITRFDPNLETALSTHHDNRWGSGYFFEKIFDIKTLAGNKQKIIDKYLSHNENVIDYFHHQQKELLILDLSKGNNWEMICPYLNCDIPSIPFPHLNKSSNQKNIIEEKQSKTVEEPSKTMEEQTTIFDQLNKKNISTYKELFKIIPA